MTEPFEHAADPRADEDDLDLLTFTEVGIRLATEIANAAQAIAAAPDASAAAALRERLTALEAAQARHRRRARDHDAFERFFGYRADADD